MKTIAIGFALLLGLNYAMHVSGFIMPETTPSSNPNGNREAVVICTGIRG